MDTIEKIVTATVGIAIVGLLVWGAIALVSSAPPSSYPEYQAPAEATYPEPTNYAVDAAGVLSVVQLETLNLKLKGMDSEKHQFGVVIVETTEPLSIEEYSIKLAEKWRVGNRDTSNGALIVIATEDRKVRIEVGYGLEGDINDAKAGAIIDSAMIPSLKTGDWYGAIVNALAAINSEVK